VLIHAAVDTGSAFVSFDKTEPLPPLQWFRAEAAARVDLSGGWTDTPPVSYDHGGSVTNVAVIIDGRRPIGARARRLEELHCVFRLMPSGEEGAVARSVVMVKSTQDLADYCAPSAPAALLKAAVLCLGIVKLEGDELEDQLRRAGGGLEVEAWSDLPTGSGLGTSSILAGAALKAMGGAMGIGLGGESLVHAVLQLEQMLTTGGGWQDQVGGLLPGAKIARSAASLPLKVCTTVLSLPSGMAEEIATRMALIYTGRTRLARNLLQDVIRRWFARLPEMVETVDALSETSETCAQAIERGDVDQVGRSLSRYWEQKKCIAPGSQPDNVRDMMLALEPHASGLSLAGAGGGGFLVYIAKQTPPHGDKVHLVAKRILVEAGLSVERLSFHSAEVDTQGLVTRVEGTGE